MTAGTEERYHLDRRIATGGMGEVWAATDTVLGREVAVKLLKAEYADDATFRSRFQAEARHAASLHHPNVATVFDFGELRGDRSAPTARPFLVMELVDGQPLSALLRGGQPMQPERAAGLVAQAADAIEAAHALGIVHRDVKPANLLVTGDGLVKITDFGIARAADGAALTTTGQVVGTPQYLSPEQAEGKPATAASDVYALGVVLYECLAGRRPFDAESPIGTALAHLNDEPPPLPDTVPANLRGAVGRALQKRPEDRFASAGEMAAAVRGQTSEPAGTGRPRSGSMVADPGVPEPTRALTVPPAADRPARRALPGWLPWAGGALGVLAVVVLLVLVGNNHADQPTGTHHGPPPSGPSSPTRSSAPASPSTVPVAAADYVGRPANRAERELAAKGLKVTTQPRPNDGHHAAGTVAAVSPTGQVPRGSPVTLTVWSRPAPSPAPPKHGHHHGKPHGHGKKD